MARPDPDPVRDVDAPRTLTDAAHSACTRWAERTALQHGRRRITYGELGTVVEQLASAYLQLGVVRGDRIVCQLPNRPELIIAVLAAWRIGAIHVGVDPDAAPDEVEWRVARTRARVLVTFGHSARGGSEAVRSDSTAAALVRCEHPELIVVEAGSAHASLHSRALEELLDESPKAALLAGVGPSPDDPALIFFTSGTTGSPKGIVRYHGQLAQMWWGVARRLALRPDDVHLVHLPPAHAFGFSKAIMALMTGGELVHLERFSPEGALDLITRNRVTVLHGTAAHFTLLTDRLDPARHDVSSLRIGQGSATRFSTELVRRIYDRLGMELMLLYGSSEGLGCSTTDRDDILAGSVGRPSADDVRIVGPDHTQLPRGEVGEVACRRIHGFTYWAAEGVEPSPDDPEWYYTGDLGRIDSEGRLFLLGRIPHEVNRGGIRINPGEVEAVLASHPDLADSAVVGIPDPVAGQVVAACIVPAAGRQTPDLAAVRAFLSPHVARHKLPEALIVLPEIPRTKLGKVERDQLAGAQVSERLRRVTAGPNEKASA